MSTFAFLFLCIQACLIQAAFGNCGCGKARAWPSKGYSKGYSYGAGGGCGAAGMSAMGSGDVAVTGEMDVSGLTTVAGSVPVLGGLSFGGLVPASGQVTISGACAYPKPVPVVAPCAAIAGAEIAEAAIAGAELAGAIAGAELAGAIAGAEWAAFNAPRYYTSAPATTSSSSCGCHN